MLSESKTVPPWTRTRVGKTPDSCVSGTDLIALNFLLKNIEKQKVRAFQNPAGLTPIGKNLYLSTPASGNAIVDAPGSSNMGTLTQGFLERSNVSLVEEMVNMITAQRAYEVNSKAIQSADEMLKNTNNLVR